MNHARQNRRRKARARAKLARWRLVDRRGPLQKAIDSLSPNIDSAVTIRLSPTGRTVRLATDGRNEVFEGRQRSKRVPFPVPPYGSPPDYATLEMRCLADTVLDGEVTLVAGGGDPHRLTAVELFKVPYSEVTSAMRNAAKRVTFAKRYGMSKVKIGEMIHAAIAAEEKGTG